MSMLVASERKARAVELAHQGRSYDQIAQEVGYTNRGTAWRTVQRALKERSVSAVDRYREEELARLDALQAASWPQAMQGSINAIRVVLKVMEQRARLLGLVSPDMATKEGNRTMLVLPQDEAELLKGTDDQLEGAVDRGLTSGPGS